MHITTSCNSDHVSGDVSPIERTFTPLWFVQRVANET